MGAAKNARKARRKARRLENRRPYVVDLETFNHFTYGWPAGPTSLADARDSVAVISHYNPRTRKQEVLGYRLDLTVAEAAELRTTKRTVTPYDPDASPLFKPKYQGLLDYFAKGGTLDTKSVFDYPHWLDAATARLSARTGAIPPLDSLDFSKLETRAMAHYMQHADLSPKEFQDLYMQTPSLSDLDMRVAKTVSHKQRLAQSMEEMRGGPYRYVMDYEMMGYRILPSPISPLFNKDIV